MILYSKKGAWFILVKVIVGLKGSGKTKKLVELVMHAVDVENGNIVCIEKDKNLTYDIPYTARLVHASDYDIGTYELMKGFLCGLYAGNYDITHIFIDNFLKMVEDPDIDKVARFLDWLEIFSNNNGVKFTITAALDPATLGDKISKYYIR